jgi:anhydro-N-acetylmuramic acid kinase
MPVKLIAKKTLNILGINSGTSADGVDLALIRFVKSGRRPRIRFLGGAVIPYPIRVRRMLEDAIAGRIADTEELARLDMSYGRFLGQAARQFMCDGNHRIDLVGSHGQTVGHYPKRKRTGGDPLAATIQIGDGNAVASASGLPVVCDFRRADIALGGEGAPLTPFVNHLLFGHQKRSRIIVNIGGIANYSYHPAGGGTADVAGGDCGPGNVMSDLACRLLFHTKYDRDGALAHRGNVIDELIRPIEAANKRRGVSAGREQFDWQLLARIVHLSRRHRAGKCDIMASIADATAHLIHKSIRRHLRDKRLDGIYLTGGGRRNTFMVERLQMRSKDIAIRPVEALGFDGDLLEALSFAVLAGCFIVGIPSTMPHITGGDAGGIAGKLALPPK